MEYQVPNLTDPTRSLCHLQALQMVIIIPVATILLVSVPCYSPASYFQMQ